MSFMATLRKVSWSRTEEGTVMAARRNTVLPAGNSAGRAVFLHGPSNTYLPAAGLSAVRACHPVTGKERSVAMPRRICSFFSMMR